MNPALSIDRLSFRYPGEDHDAVSEISIDVRPGGTTAILGPSGCGKTTVLKLAAGLLAPQTGTIHIAGADVTHVPPERRPSVLVFQDTRLFPFMTIEKNVAFGLRVAGCPRAETGSRVAEILEQLDIGRLAQRRPAEISGGQAQRAALARALVLRPHVLLLDEPFSSLDAQLRHEMRDLIAAVQREYSQAILLVTHDHEDAATLADRVAVMFEGRVHHYGPPQSLFEQPKTARVARAIGVATVIAGTATAVGWQTSAGEAPHRSRELPPAGTQGMLAVPPEAIALARTSEPSGELTGELVEATPLGTHTRYRVRTPDGTVWTTSRIAEGGWRPSVGEAVALHVDLSQVWPLETSPP